MRKRILKITGATAAALLLASCGQSPEGSADSAAQENGAAGLDQAVVSTYGTSTGTYAELALVAEQLTGQRDINVRIINSDTAIGRLTPLKDGQAGFARTGDEYYYAFEAMHEFADPEWGPQPTRVVWGAQMIAGLLVTEGSGIESVEDLKGKKVPDVTANPSVNSKITSALEGAGLTRDDTESVAISYGEQASALQNGSIDVMYMSTESSSISELEVSTGVQWIDLPTDSEDMQQAFLDNNNPSVVIDEFTATAGQPDGEPDGGIYYPAPVISYADTEEQDVYDLVAGIVETYDAYKDSMSTMSGWSLEGAATEPAGVPFHDGTIKYLEEQGLWTDEAQEKQDELLAREEQLVEGWEEVSQGDGDLETSWEEWKADNL